MRLAAPEAKTAEPRSSTFSPRCSACTMLPNTVSTMVSVSFFREAGDAGLLLHERRVGTSISRSCPFHRGLEALRQVGSAAPAGGLERARRGQSAPGAPPRRPSESLRPHSALRPAGGRRPLAQPSPLSGPVSPTAAGPVPQLDGLALAQVSLVDGSVPCFDPHGQQRAGDGARRQWPPSTARLEAR